MIVHASAVGKFVEKRHQTHTGNIPRLYIDLELRIFKRKWLREKIHKVLEEHREILGFAIPFRTIIWWPNIILAT
jgi:hypothetical protein